MSAEHNYLEDLKNQGVIESDTVKIDSIDNEESLLRDEETSFDEFSEPSLIVVEKENIGRKNNNVPDFLRRTIAVVANTSNENQVSIAKEFGVSQGAVSQAKNGRNSNGDTIPELRTLTNELKEDKKSTREMIEDEALLRTLSTLKILTPNDIECLGAKDKADVAVKLSKVAANMRDKVVNNDNRMLLIIKSPPIREELHYDTVQVG